jgi:putative endonuclease
MWYVYCLENKAKSYLYVGSTPNLRKRLAEHNAGKSKSTKPYIPLFLTAYIAVSSEQHARRLEKYLKSGSGKAILKKRILQTEAFY